MTRSPSDQENASAASILSRALQWKEAGDEVALATIVKAWATAPRRAGAQMAVRRDGTTIGTVFGPGVDAQVASAAVEALAVGDDRTVSIDITDATASNAGMACGGEMQIRFECLRSGPAGQVDILREAMDALKDRRSVVLCTRLSDGRRSLISSDDPGVDAWAPEARRRAMADDTAITEVAGDDVLFQVFNAPLRLYVVGAVRTARALLAAAQLVGFEVSILDPRPEFASALDFTGARLLVGDAAGALREARLDSRCAVVMLSHSSGIDDPALIEAVASKAFYVGALGSRRSHAARLERLADAGVPPRLSKRIHGPAGLDIGAMGPAEIAASIVAEMITALRKSSPGE
ncbi:XdhC family protein [Variovorax sp. J2P1-59]|uniref:XdhC family protein n=1 Tax=Variovorax flavidus TaxID=3053501 RepID=UPI00257789C3|nr:XdhC/CoxI family protein [Variovorax sp. J2P1-59]MDM0073688.1 XdhC family protein [Variovorax sp. J2P1-59]